MSTDKWTLEEVCEKGSSSLMQKNLKLGTGAFPIYGASGLLGFVDFYHRQEEYIGIVKDGAGVGRAMLLPAQSSCIGTMQYLIPNQNVTAHYLYYAIQNMNLAKYNTGATIPHIYFRDYKRESIPKRSIQEQEIISEKIDKVENIIKIKREQLSHLDDLVKSQFIEMFGSIRDNRFNFPVGTIGQECVLKSGTSLPVEVENEGGDIPYVKVGDMTYKGSEKYILESSHMVSQMTAESGLFPPGTIIFPKRGGAIGTNKKRITAIPICADLNIMAVIPGKRISAQYLYSYFLAIDLGKLNNGSTVPQINNKDIAPLKILVPPTERQDEFARFVEQTDKSKDIYGLEAAA